MNEEQIRLVRASYGRFAPVAAEFGAEFYRALFELDPAARALFPGDMAQQSRKLVEMIGTVVDLLDRPDALVASCTALGRRHARYGVTEDHYDDVGSALLRTLRLALKNEFTVEVEEAWAAVYGEMAEAMIAGQAESVAP